jgi:hypothetical protein
MTDPQRPFGDPRNILETHLSALVEGDAAAARRVLLSYRISGGPPGKRLLELLEVKGTGETTYKQEDELARGRRIRSRIRLARNDVLGLFQEVRASGLLRHPDTGGGFLPDSTIGSITLEAPNARLTYHFLATDTQRAAQHKELSEPLRVLKPILEGLSQTVRSSKRQRPRRKGD